MSWTKQKQRLQKFAQQYDKSIILVTKNSWFWHALAAILAFFHIQTKEQFLKHYATTIGPVQAYPEEWLVSSVEETLVHESEHTHQCRMFGFMIHPWVGLPFMGIFYLLIFFPILLAYARYRMELGAEKVRLEWMLDNNIPTIGVLTRAEHFAEAVASWRYGKSMPSTIVHRGFRKMAEKIIWDKRKEKISDLYRLLPDTSTWK